MSEKSVITVRGAAEHNLKNIDCEIDRGHITVVTGVSGSGKSSLAFDTVLAEAHRRFFYTLSHYTRQFLDLGTRPKVRQVQGLSPAIGLAQNETLPSRKATVGTLSDVSELWGVVLARFGDKACPKHQVPITALSVGEILQNILRDHQDETIAIGAPVAKAKKGHFANQLTKFAQKGYTKALIDGKLKDLEPIPELVKEEKHDITVIVDLVKVKPDREKRLERSLETTLELTEGYGEYYRCPKAGEIDLESVQVFSSHQGCPQCGFAWPRLDSRYFSTNSLGRCEECDGYGEINGDDDEDEQSGSRLDAEDRRCKACLGTGLNADLKAITIAGKSMHDLQLMPLCDLKDFVQDLLKNYARLNPALKRVLEEIDSNISRITTVGLPYLTLSRRVRSLSSGEAQRLRLSGVLGENLRGVLYVLDEPSQGLHPSELDRVWASLEELKRDGNTLVLVDHDETLIRRADWVIDLGPGGGAQGGHLLAKFKPKDAPKFSKASLTARHLTEQKPAIAWHEARNFKDFLTIKKPRLHNLRLKEAKIPLNALTVVTGVSGAGKSTLIQSVLYENALAQAAQFRSRGRKKFNWRYCDEIKGLESIQAVELIDRRPIAKSSVSMPATYLDVFGELRTFYSKLKDAQIAGLTQKSFSLAQGEGRCEECDGRGEISLNMRFLAAAKVKCPVCKGARYRSHVLTVKFNGLSISDVLNLTIQEAVEHFANFPRIKRKLEPACRLGLGYLKLGQLSMHLSGGESQRLKLVTLFHKSKTDGSLLILDEPTTGLHVEDVAKLVNELRELIRQGATIVIIEHNQDVIRAADWLIDMGPGSALAGGDVVYQGDPHGILKVSSSKTAAYLH